jgi:hypothetical protein
LLKKETFVIGSGNSFLKLFSNVSMSRKYNPSFILVLNTNSKGYFVVKTSFDLQNKPDLDLV